MNKEFPMSDSTLRSMLSKNVVARFIENEFIADYPLRSIHDARLFLQTNLEVTTAEVRTSSTPGRYDEHYVFLFAPTNCVEKAIAVREVSQLLTSIEVLAGTKTFDDFQKYRTQLISRREDLNMQHADIEKFYRSACVVFLFANPSGVLRPNVDESKDFVFSGVFNIVPNDIV